MVLDQAFDLILPPQCNKVKKIPCPHDHLQNSMRQQEKDTVNQKTPSLCYLLQLVPLIALQMSGS